MVGARSGQERLVDLAELELGEVEALFAARELPSFHARQVFRWFWKRGVADFSAMTDLGLALRGRLAQEVTFGSPTVVKRDISEDGTQKFVLRLRD